MLDWSFLILIFFAGLWAGVQNALAGGGSFIILPALIFTGISPLAANVSSTIALFPGQLLSGWSSRSLAQGIGKLTVGWLIVISVIGGAAGGWLLLHTPESVFARLVPWLVLVATAVFVWGNFFRKQGAAHDIGWPLAAGAQFVISIYGGYFGGGIGILMLAALTMAGMQTRNAGATKNLLAGMMNASAVVLFLFSPMVSWERVFVLGFGAIIGGQIGAKALFHVNELALKLFVVAIGILLSIGLFLRPL